MSQFESSYVRVRVSVPFLFELAKVCFSLRLQEVTLRASALRAMLGHTRAKWVSVGLSLFWCFRWECVDLYVLGLHWNGVEAIRGIYVLS